MNGFGYGFRILGGCFEQRRLVDHGRAFEAYADCNDAAEPGKESYLSAFQFADNFRAHLTETQSTAGFSGACWARHLWLDIDRPNIEDALRDTRRLALRLTECYGVDDALLIFFSGSKGFHVGLPVSLWSGEPSADFNRYCRKLAESIGERCGITIDCGVYDRVRAFRAPNSRHPKTGRHKRFIDYDTLLAASLESIVAMAQSPEPFELPDDPAENRKANSDWQAAVEAVRQESMAKAERIASGEPGRLNRSTLAFIRDGAFEGDRHRLLFSAAANLAELGAPLELAFALLEDGGRDSGLPPKEVRRQVECGHAHGFRPVLTESTPHDCDTGAIEAPDVQTPQDDAERNSGASGAENRQSCHAVTPEPQSSGPSVSAADLAALWASRDDTPNRPPGADTDRSGRLDHGPAVDASAASLRSTPSTTTAEDLERLWAGRGDVPPPTPALPPDPEPIGCDHKWTDERLSDGRIRRVCSLCGRFFGYVRDEGKSRR